MIIHIIISSIIVIIVVIIIILIIIIIIIILIIIIFIMISTIITIATSRIIIIISIITTIIILDRLDPTGTRPDSDSAERGRRGDPRFRVISARLAPLAQSSSWNRSGPGRGSRF